MEESTIFWVLTLHKILPLPIPARTSQSCQTCDCLQGQMDFSFVHNYYTTKNKTKIISPPSNINLSAFWKSSQCQGCQQHTLDCVCWVLQLLRLPRSNSFLLMLRTGGSYHTGINNSIGTTNNGMSTSRQNRGSAHSESTSRQNRGSAHSDSNENDD
jgi:hypothetical protein